MRRSTNETEGIEPGAFLLCQDESLRKTISPKEDWRTGRLDSSKAGGPRAGGLEDWRAEGLGVAVVRRSSSLFFASTRACVGPSHQGGLEAWTTRWLHG